MSTRFAGVIIPNGAAVSNVFDLKGYRIAGIINPATWTAADISFEVETKQNSGVYVKVVSAAGALIKLTGVSTTASEMLVTNTQSQYVTSPGRAKIVSTNTASEADANQTGDKTVIVILEPIWGSGFGT